MPLPRALQPGIRSVVGQRTGLRKEFAQENARIGADSQIDRLLHLPDFGRVNVDHDDACRAGEILVIERERRQIKPRPNDDKAIRILLREVRPALTHSAGPAAIKWVLFW